MTVREIISEWIPAIAIVGTGLFALFKAGGFVQKITDGLERVNERFDKFISEFHLFRQEDKDVHDKLGQRLEKIEDKVNQD